MKKCMIEIFQFGQVVWFTSIFCLQLPLLSLSRGTTSLKIPLVACPHLLSSSFEQGKFVSRVEEKIFFVCLFFKFPLCVRKYYWYLSYFKTLWIRFFSVWGGIQIEYSDVVLCCIFFIIFYFQRRIIICRQFNRIVQLDWLTAYLRLEV